MLFSNTSKKLYQTPYYSVFLLRDLLRDSILIMKQFPLFFNLEAEPIPHPKHKYTSIVQVYDKNALVSKAVNIVNVLEPKKYKLHKY